MNSFASLQKLGGQHSLPATMEAILDTIQVPLPTATLRAIAALALRDREVTPQGLGRVAGYEMEGFRKRRTGAPRFSWVLDPEGTAVKPRIWARGGWPLRRRLLTPDAVGNWTVTAAMFLVREMAEGDDWTRRALAKVAQEMTSRVLGPIAVYGEGSRADWSRLAAELAPHQSQVGLDSPTREQREAAERLESAGMSPFSIFFGVDEIVRGRSDALPGRLTLARPGEGVPFDQFVLGKTENEVEGREVLAYIQEWGWLVDRLERSVTFKDYAERWQTDLATVRRRNDQFVALFPGEETPDRIWNLLWSGLDARESFIRLMGRPVVERELAPGVVNRFISALAFELREVPSIGKKAAAELAGFEETESIDPGREMRRFFALAERTRLWGAQALLAAQEPELVKGTLSIESVTDGDTAAAAEHALGEYRRQLPKGPARDLLLNAQKTLRVAATIDALNPPPGTAHYLTGVEWAAKALAVARAPELRAIDLVAEARATVRALEGLH